MIDINVTSVIKFAHIARVYLGQNSQPTDEKSLTLLASVTGLICPADTPCYNVSYLLRDTTGPDFSLLTFPLCLGQQSRHHRLGEITGPETTNFTWHQGQRHLPFHDRNPIGRRRCLPQMEGTGSSNQFTCRCWESDFDTVHQWDEPEDSLGGGCQGLGC